MSRLYKVVDLQTDEEMTFTKSDIIHYANSIFEDDEEEFTLEQAIKALRNCGYSVVSNFEDILSTVQSQREYRDYLHSLDAGELIRLHEKLIVQIEINETALRYDSDISLRLSLIQDVMYKRMQQQ